MNKAKRILELDAKAMQTAKQILGFEPGIDRLRTSEESILANAYTSLVSEVERDYVRKDRLLNYLRLNFYRGKLLDNVVDIDKLSEAIKAGELDGDS